MFFNILKMAAVDIKVMFYIDNCFMASFFNVDDLLRVTFVVLTSSDVIFRIHSLYHCQSYMKQRFNVN
jgi:hypothetical protein